MLKQKLMAIGVSLARRCMMKFGYDAEVLCSVEGSFAALATY